MTTERTVYALEGGNVRKLSSDNGDTEGADAIPKTARAIEEREVPKIFLEGLLESEREIRAIAPPGLVVVRQFYCDGVGENTVYYLYGTYPSAEKDGTPSTIDFLIEGSFKFNNPQS